MRVFRDLGLVEQLGSGVPRILETYSRDCFTFSDNFLRMAFPAPEMDYSEGTSQVSGEVGGHATEISLNDPEKAILEILEEGPCSTSELLENLGLESRTGAFRRNVKSLMENGLIEYMYPENPKHPDQKYRLTDQSNNSN